MRTGRPKTNGAALVIVLAFIVLLTITIVAFFAQATLERSISDTSANLHKADDLARSAMATIIGDFRQEMFAGSRADGTPTGAIYLTNQFRIMVPTTNRTAVPERDTNASTFPNLVRRSANDPNAVVFPTTAYNASLLPPRTASPARSDTPSANNRRVSAEDWNAPRLLTADTAPASTNWIPDWVLMTRSGPRAFGSWTNTLRDPSLRNDDYVIGRFAFMVYDQGGLLDINVAGNRLPAAQNLRRGRMHQVDLAALRDASGNPLITDPSQLLQWRSSYTGSNTNAEPNSRSLFDPRRTFVNVEATTSATDRAFISRQDLLRYVNANPGVISSNALPLLTTFTRSKNAPSWFPQTNAPAGGRFAYANRAELPDAINRSFANVRRKTSGTIPSSSSGLIRERTVQAGEPLLHQRFPLYRLGWIGRDGPTNGATAEDVRRAFGLVYRDRGIWTYVSPDGAANSTSAANRIKTLEQVAELSAPRDPDFFELLQAGILQGSLGLSNRSNGVSQTFRTNADTRDIDRSRSRQIVQIGVNLIDQYDSDSWPTTVVFNWDKAGSDLDPPAGSPYTPTSSTNYLRNLYPGVSGIEDLPYIYKIYQTFNWHPQLQPPPPAPPNRIGIFQFVEVWNPNPQASGSGPGPTRFRVRVETGWSVFSWGQVDFRFCTMPMNYGANQQQIVFETTAGNSFRSPQVLTDRNSISGTGWTGASAMLGLYGRPTIGDVHFIPGAWDTNQDNQYRFSHLFFSSTPGPTYRLDYQNENGSWSEYPYQLFPEFCWYYDDHTGNWRGDWPGRRWDRWPENAKAAGRPDPRGVRWGFSESGGWWRINEVLGTWQDSWFGRPSYLPPTGVTDDSGRIYASGNPDASVDVVPFNDWVNWSNGAGYLGNFAFNRPGSTRYVHIDGILRSGDAVNSTAPQDSADQRFRPVILNRPFRTVGEMAYAHRDEPWKSVDFFTANSADAALLDLFTMTDADVYAGVLNLNTRQRLVTSAVITGAIQAERTEQAVSQSVAENVSDEMVGIASSADPIANVSELATRLTPEVSSGQTKMESEAAVRVLGEVGEVRTWNLLVDVVAQTGRFGPAANSLDQFIVEGQRRYWMHVAIDRYTGEIIDQQLELVTDL
ncbi:MAG: hypothetical protein SFU53_14605 [Terrimicrobiaceae bacterium]|nr:hypothetical protein [Terrimicrobiaceae bacterium]